jgi:hypothetical protein
MREEDARGPPDTGVTAVDQSDQIVEFTGSFL